MSSQKEKTMQRNFVNNVIIDIITTLNPSDDEIKWNEKHISIIREALCKLFVNEMKLCTKEQFYPK
jgi:hypothetical protein